MLTYVMGGGGRGALFSLCGFFLNVGAFLLLMDLGPFMGLVLFAKLFVGIHFAGMHITQCTHDHSVHIELVLISHYNEFYLV